MLSNLKFIKLKECFVLFLFLFVNIGSYSQNIRFIDNSLKKPIPYCQINCDNYDFYTDSKGQLTILDQCDSLYVNDYRYEKKIISFHDSIIHLNPRIINLGEVSFGNQLYSYNSLTEKQSFGFSANNKNAVLIENEINKVGILKNIEFDIKKIKNEKLYMVLSIYDREFNELNEEPIVISLRELKKNKYSINLNKENIIFPKDGLLVSIELRSDLGEINKTKEFEVAIIFRQSKKNNEMYFYSKNQWIKIPNQKIFLDISYTIMY